MLRHSAERIYRCTDLERNFRSDNVYHLSLETVQGAFVHFPDYFYVLQYKETKH